MSLAAALVAGCAPAAGANTAGMAGGGEKAMAQANNIPLIDTVIHETVETATFALG